MMEATLKRTSQFFPLAYASRQQLKTSCWCWGRDKTPVVVPRRGNTLHFSVKLLPKPVRSNVKTSSPMRKAFSAVHCLSFDVKILSSCDKTVATVTSILLSSRNAFFAVFAVFWGGIWSFLKAAKRILSGFTKPTENALDCKMEGWDLSPEISPTQLHDKTPFCKHLHLPACNIKKNQSLCTQ